MKRKYRNTDKAQWKESELTTLISEMGGGQNKETHVPPTMQIVIEDSD